MNPVPATEPNTRHAQNYLYRLSILQVDRNKLKTELKDKWQRFKIKKYNWLFPFLHALNPCSKQSAPDFAKQTWQVMVLSHRTEYQATKCKRVQIPVTILVHSSYVCRRDISFKRIFSVPNIAAIYIQCLYSTGKIGKSNNFLTGSSFKNRGSEICFWYRLWVHRAHIGKQINWVGKKNENVN